MTAKTARDRLLQAINDDACTCGGEACPTPDALIDAYAHELAEQQRNHFGVGDAPTVRAHCDPHCDFCQGVTRAADLIDPERQP